MLSIPGDKKRLHRPFFAFVEKKNDNQKIIGSFHLHILSRYRLSSDLICSGLDPETLLPVSMTGQNLSLFSLGAIQWRQVTVLCIEVNFLVSFLFLRLLATLSLVWERVIKRGEGQDGQKGCRVQGSFEGFWLGATRHLSSNIVFSYILKIILAHFHFNPYFLLFTLVIANTKPAAVLRIFDCKLCGKLYIRLLKDLKFKKRKREVF